MSIFSYASSKRLDLDVPAIDKDLIQKINSNPKSTWKAGENDFFKNKTLRDVKRLLGSKKNVKKIGKVDDSKIDVSSLPASYDLRVQYPNSTTINNILNQGVKIYKPI